MCWAVNQQEDFISAEGIFWIQTFYWTDTTGIVAWYKEKGATARFSWGSNHKILWGHTRTSHQLQSEVRTEKWSREDLASLCGSKHDSQSKSHALPLGIKRQALGLFFLHWSHFSKKRRKKPHSVY